MLETMGKKRILFNDNDEERKITEICAAKSRRVLNPIIDWSNDDVWRYIKLNNIDFCDLYNEGFKRIGCIMCPMAGTDQMLLEAERWPKYYQAYLRAFERMLKNRKQDESYDWKTAQDVMNWWIYEMPKQEPGQMELEFEDEDED